MKSCRKHYKHSKHKRVLCEKQARKRYAPKKTVKTHKAHKTAHKAARGAKG